MLVYQRTIPHNSCLAFRTFPSTFHSVWHTQSEFEIVHIEGGSGNVQYADRRKPYEQGDILVLGPNVPHQYLPRGPLRSLSILFRSDFLVPGFFDAELTRNIGRFLGRASEGLLFCGAKDEMELMDRVVGETGLTQAANFLLLLEKLSRRREGASFGVRASALDKSDRLRGILRYISANAHRTLHIEEVARAMGMSRCHFSRFFNQQAGMTFNAHVVSLRIDRACELLRTTDRKVADIAFEVGFESISSFNRGFCGRMGDTPINFRRNSRWSSDNPK